MEHLKVTWCVLVGTGSSQVLFFPYSPWLVNPVNIRDSPVLELALIGTYVVNHGQIADEYSFSIRINGRTNQRSKQSSVKNDVLNYVEGLCNLILGCAICKFSITSNLRFILGLDESLAKPQNSNWAEVAKSSGQSHVKKQSDVAIFAMQDSGWDWKLLH